jgi:hypothetical protein
LPRIEERRGKRLRRTGRLGGGRNKSRDEGSFRVSSIRDKSSPVEVSGRLTEKFVLATECARRRENTSLIRWEVPARRPTSGGGMRPSADLGQPTPRFIVELSRKFDDDYSGIIRDGRFSFVRRDPRRSCRTRANEKSTRNSRNFNAVKS